MARRSVAVVAAVVLLCEAVAVVLAHLFLGMVVDEQQMSLGGLAPGAMRAGTVAGGALLGLFLVLCAGLLLRTAFVDRPPGRFARGLLIGAAVLHGVLGALLIGLVGWLAFAVLMLTLALLVGTLVAYGPVDRPRDGGGKDTGRDAPTPA